MNIFSKTEIHSLPPAERNDGLKNPLKKYQKSLS